MATVLASVLGIGDTLLVRSGARVPADGEIVDGSAELDEAMITGESRPVPKTVGDKVVAGTVSTDSSNDIPPTGKSFEVDFCTVARWHEGQIVEENLFYDLVSFMQQLGLSG